MKAIILGAGAQGRITAEIWRAAEPGIELLFLDDDDALHGRRIGGVPVAGPIRCLADHADGCRALIAIGNNVKRLAAARSCSQAGAAWAVVVHPSAVVMPSATVGEGTIVMAHALVNSGAWVGKHVIINSAAVVEHDSRVEDGASLGPGVSCGARVHIGRGAFVSTGATIAPRLRIGAGTIVGAGAVVVNDLPEGVLAYGVPARTVRKLEEEADFSRVL